MHSLVNYGESFDVLAIGILCNHQDDNSYVLRRLWKEYDSFMVVDHNNSHEQLHTTSFVILIESNLHNEDHF